VLPPGTTPITPGVNPQVHPVWVPEYFGDHVVVNGVLWPKKSVEAGWTRIRVVDGSDSRCWTLGFSTTMPAPGTKPNNNVSFVVIANDQGYLPVPKQAVKSFTMCPGERYELLVNFGVLPGPAPAPGTVRTVFMTNSAAAPYPAGLTPFAAASPFAEMNVVMRFDVAPPSAAAPGVPTCGVAGLTWPTIPPTVGCIAIPILPDPNFVSYTNPVPPMCAPGQVTTPTVPCVSAVRQLYLNEKADGTTLFPLGMQINGVPFEYKVTETPKKGTIEIWRIINLTVDAHPMHPHLVKHQIIGSQTFNVGKYKAALCGSTTCQPGQAPGGEMYVIPDVTPMLTGTFTPNLPTDFDAGWKDASIVLPGRVTSIIAKWDAGWPAAVAPALATAPGTAGGPADLSVCTGLVGAPAACNAPSWTYDTVGSGPYVWHCHINSHEDSEMMRTSLVVP
jgi:FtsP/CotA-like multicopper oxidase with cupredoxin domain